MISAETKISQVEHSVSTPFQHSLETDLRLPTLNNDSLGTTPFFVYRNEYKKNAADLGMATGMEERFCFPMPSLEKVKETTASNLIKFLPFNNDNILIMGLSGDLDSSFTLLLLYRIIEGFQLNCQIQPFYIKNDFHVHRARRVEKLMKYLNKNSNGKTTTLKVFDMAILFDFIQHAVRSHTEGVIRPSSPQQITDMQEVFSSAINRIIPAEDGIPDRAKKTNIVDVRERSNLIHELIVAARGYLCRQAVSKNDEPAVVIPTNASEFVLGNFTTSDLFGTIAPLAHLPKSVIAHLFRELIRQTNGGIREDQWEYSLTTQVPYYPDKMTVQRHGDKIHFTRRAENVHPHADFEFDPAKSKIPAAILDGFSMTPEGYARVPGEIQFTLDTFMHHFLLAGCTDKQIAWLANQAPDQTSDIKLTAFLMAAAREKPLKDRYMARVL